MYLSESLREKIQPEQQTTEVISLARYKTTAIQPLEEV